MKSLFVHDLTKNNIYHYHAFAQSHFFDKLTTKFINSNSIQNSEYTQILKK